MAECSAVFGTAGTANRDDYIFEQCSRPRDGRALDGDARHVAGRKKLRAILVVVAFAATRAAGFSVARDALSAALSTAALFASRGALRMALCSTRLANAPKADGARSHALLYSLLRRGPSPSARALIAKQYSTSSHCTEVHVVWTPAFSCLL